MDEYGNSNTDNLMDSIVLLECTTSLNTKLSNFKIMTGNPLNDYGGINSTSKSGAILVWNSYVQLDNIEFSNSFRGIYANSSSLNISNCNFYRNLGGAGAAILAMGGCHTKVDNCSFVENKTLYNFQGGGAIENNGSSLYVNNSVFLNNTSQENGGAINNYNGHCYLFNSTITGNTCFNLYTATPGKIYGGGIYSVGAHGVDLIIANSIVDYNYQYYEMYNHPNNSSITANDIYVAETVQCRFYYSTIGSYAFKDASSTIYDEYSLTTSPTDLETPFLKNISSYPVNLSQSFYSNQSLKRPILSKATPYDNTNFVTGYVPLNDEADVATLKGCRTIFDVRFTILTSTTYDISSYFAYEKDGILTQIQNTFDAGIQVSTTFVDTYFETKIINRANDQVYRGASYTSSLNWALLRKTKTAHGNIAGISYVGDSYIIGTPVTIYAVPNDGYAFSKWDDGSTDPTRIITLNSNTIVSATFEVGYQVTYNPGTYGLGNIYPSSGKEGAIIKLSNEMFTRSRYIQDGWTSTIDGKKEYPLGKKIILLENMTLYPTWAHEYSINNCVYNADGTYTVTYEDGFIETLNSIPSPGGDLINGLVDPTNTIGNNGDSYLNTTSWDYFIKYANYWIKLGNTKGGDGKDGLNGTNGNTILTGTTAPLDTLGNNGDSYVDTTSWDYYVKANGTWTKIGSIKGIDGLDGKDGLNGTNGSDGKDGNDGLNGTNGTKVLTGTIDPTTEGVVGDTYINTTSWDVFIKNGTGWVKTGNIKGNDGVDGVDGTNGTNGVDGKDGSTIMSADTIPGPALGNDGDSYINTSTWDYYTKSSGRWILMGNIKGSSGVDGTNGTDGNNGTSLLTGSTAPLNTLGNNGDSYVDTSTWDYYIKSNNVWVKTGNIKGNDGTNGVDGKDGQNGTDGTNGTNGNTILTGTTTPLDTLGNNGDSYVDTT